MAKNSMTISFSQNSPSSESDSVTSNIRTNSFIQRNQLQQPITTTNQPGQNIPIVTPIAKKPRGRPPGSKNKPKLRATSFSAALQSLGPLHVIVNVAPGRDIMESILGVAFQRCVNLTVLSASGTIASVTLRHSHSEVTTHMLNGPFTMLSMNGTYSTIHQYPPLSFSISLSTSQGQLFGGPIAGRVIAGDNVRIVLCTYKNLEFYKFAPESKEGGNNNSDNKNHPSDFNGGGNLSGFDMLSGENFDW